MTVTASGIRSEMIVFPTETGYTDTGLKTCYVEEEPRELPKRFQKEAQKTECAYILREANEDTPNIKGIIKSRRLVELEVQNGELQAIRFHPKYKLIQDVNKFILFMFNIREHNEVAILINRTTTLKLTREEYKNQSQKLKKCKHVKSAIPAGTLNSGALSHKYARPERFLEGQPRDLGKQKKKNHSKVYSETSPKSSSPNSAGIAVPVSTIVGEIGSVTINNLEMYTWHDKNLAILSLVSITTLQSGGLLYALRECNLATIKSAAQFENLVDNDRIYAYTKKGELISCLNAADPEEKGPFMYCLLKGGTGGESGFIDPSSVTVMANPRAILKTKTQLKKISAEFEQVLLS